jgi:hypothetical protein
MPIKLEERSIYSYIINFLESEFKAKTLIEGRVEKGYVDIFFALDSSPFVLEIKLGKQEKKLADAIAQAWKYADKLNTRNVVALVFPRIQSGQTILVEHLPRLKEIILNEVVEGYIHTDYWEKWIEGRALKDVLAELAERFYKKKSEYDFNSIVKAIREVVQDLYTVIRQAKTEEIFEEVAEKLELFVGLGEKIKDKKEAVNRVSMLASYLLFNQLLFYHIYKIKTKDERIEELRPINSLKDLKKCFKKIVEIDYQPIYAINLIDKIPENPEVIELINKAITNLLVIRVEYVTQDLAGRFFHALLPKEVAKVWAAFYTNPIAAEILANLAIDRWDETAFDPACGSGTLLAACYRRKLELYEKQTGKKLDEETVKKLHKKFIEEDITGNDIMPFAAHLTAINLATQKLEQPTNVVRVARMDSLELAPKTQLPEFKKEGILLKSFIGTVQLTLYGKRKVIKKVETISPAGRGVEFRLKPVDVVIMNPPFSDWQKLPINYREKLKKLNQLGNICGYQVNLWGYFLALADLLLKPNGKIAAVLPINIARGGATEKIRNYLLKNYKIKYIIKSTKDFAFSESASFRDILLIAQKTKPENADLTKIIFLKKSIREMSYKDVIKITSEIKSLKASKNEIYSSTDFDVYVVDYEKLIKHMNNLMLFLGLLNVNNTKIFLTFIEQVQEDKLTNLKKEFLKYGFPDYPAGLSEIVFIVRPIDKSRERRAFLLLRNENEEIVIKIKNIEKTFKLPKKIVIPALKTITGVKSFLLNGKHDYLITSSFEDSDFVIKTSHWKGKSFSWERIKTMSEKFKTFLAIPRRFNLYSPNTYILSIFSTQKFIPTNKFLLCQEENIEKCKILSLYLNSLLFFIQLILYKSETTGEYIEIMEPDLVLFKILNEEKLTNIEKQFLLNSFEKLKNVEFPSIMEQFEKRFWARVELDRTILKVLGLSDKEIEEWLPKLYDAIVEELKAMKEVK